MHYINQFHKQSEVQKGLKKMKFYLSHSSTFTAVHLLHAGIFSELVLISNTWLLNGYLYKQHFIPQVTH